jgi:hypothetical protein
MITLLPRSSCCYVYIPFILIIWSLPLTAGGREFIDGNVQLIFNADLIANLDCVFQLDKICTLLQTEIYVPREW